MMKEKSINYFSNIIMPMIRERHNDILNEISFQIGGSVGLGIDDEFSDLEAAIYLPDEIWKQNGLLQINLIKCLSETNLWQQGGSIISVYPLSWLLDGQAEKILAGNDIDWEKIQFDSLFGLFVLHNQPIWHDPQDRLGKLRRMTAPDKMPEILWKKALLEKIKVFVSDGIEEVNRCVDRKHYIDAYIPFGDAVKALLEIGFMVCRQYYPYRKHLSWAFGRLPSPISELSSHFDLLSASTDWQERLSIMETIFNVYKDYIISNNLLPELDFSRVDLREWHLFGNALDNAGNTLSSPNVSNDWVKVQERTVELGFGPEAEWVVNWFEM